MRISLFILALLAAPLRADGPDDAEMDRRARLTFNGGAAPRQAPPRRLPASPEARRAALDEAVALCGEDALPFCREFGDDGILVCLHGPGPAKALAELYRSGALSKVRELPRVVAACREFGGPCTAWVASNHKLLEDDHAAAVFLADPREAALGLVDVGRRADALRQQRRGPLAAVTAGDWKKLGLGAALGAGALWAALWWKRRQGGGGE